MASDRTRVMGGPLDGNFYDLSGTPGETIELNTAAGVCTYRFAAEERDLVLHYVGRTTVHPPDMEDTLSDAIEDLGTTEPRNTDDDSASTNP